jgi:hypothetical protein
MARIPGMKNRLKTMLTIPRTKAASALEEDWDVGLGEPYPGDVWYDGGGWGEGWPQAGCC